MDRKRKLVFFTRGNRGQSVVEFSLLLPLLLVLFLAITEFGRAWMTVSVLTSAAREGCRTAIVTDPDLDRVKERVDAVCAAAGLTQWSTKVVGPDPRDPDRAVTVTVETNFNVIAGGIFKLFSGRELFAGSMPLQAKSVMRHESL